MLRTREYRNIKPGQAIYHIGSTLTDFGCLKCVDRINEKHTPFIFRFCRLLMFRTWLFVACMS
ncbi:hypothetical protein V6Z12_A06G170600 [Gossypium hirsutum]